MSAPAKGAAVVVAIDGPAASGKGTLARKIADHYRYAFLDTGALYRAVAYTVLKAGGDPARDAAAVEAARLLDMTDIADRDLRTAKVGAAASIVAAKPAVREALLSYQRRFAAAPPGGAAGAVLDGRDIGTTICPDAPIKFFVTARPEIRAHRRYLELKQTNPDVVEAAVLADLKARDARDAGRAAAPLEQAPGAVLLDTSDLSIEAAFLAAQREIDRWLSSEDRG